MQRYNWYIFSFAACFVLGSVFNSKGLNVEALKQHQEKTGSLLGFPGVERELAAAQAMDLIDTPCDILIPAALEKPASVSLSHGCAH